MYNRAMAYMHVFNDARFGHIAHVVFFIAELKRNKCIKALCFILQLAQAFHMVNTVAEFFYMSV